MSYTAQDWAWQVPVKYPHKLVLIALAYRMNEKTGQCNPSVAMVANDMGRERTSIRSIRASIKFLESLGYIKIRANYAGKGQQTSNSYVLNVGFIHQKVGVQESPRGAVVHPPKDETPVRPARAVEQGVQESTGVVQESPTNKEENTTSLTKKHSSRARENTEVFDLEAEMNDVRPASPTADDFFAAIARRGAA